MTLDDKVVKVDEAMRGVGGYPPQGRSSTSFNAYLVLEISNWAGNGVLVAVGSSYGIVDWVFDRNSPLGLFMPMEVGIISYEDVLSQVGDPLLSALLRDLWVIPFIDSYVDFARRVRVLADIKGVGGEVFREEDRELQDTTAPGRGRMEDFGDCRHNTAEGRGGCGFLYG